MKRLIFVLCVLMQCISMWAVPAKQTIFTHTQKDGSVLTLQLVGDEFMHYYQNVETGAPMTMDEDGDYYALGDAEYAVRSEHASARRSVIGKSRAKRLAPPQKAIGTYRNMTGQKKGIVILVNFQDVKFNSANNQIAFNNQFNQEGYNKNNHIGSVSDYFKKQSYGQFGITFDVVGPVTVSKEMAYYGENDASGSDKYAATMIAEAVKLADSEFGVDFSVYDWDNDGEVESVFVVYAGYAEAQGADKNTIWPHQWNLASGNYFGDGPGALQIDGKTIDAYACTAELCGNTGTTMDGIGTACHEFSHCLGYPDFYDTDKATNGNGVGMSYYDLMAAGSYNGPNANGEVPCGYSAYERWMAGWITPEELSWPVTVEGMKSIDEEGAKAYIIYNDANRNEYFLLENRIGNDYFKYYRNITQDGGLLVTHVDYDASSWTNNRVNIYSTHQRFTFVPADGSYTNSYTTDFFPTSMVTSFTDDSHTDAGGKLFAGTALGKPVTNIKKSSGLIGFDFMGGDNGDRFTITLNACGGTVATTSWTQTRMAEEWTLPEPSIAVSGWEGAGWSLSEIKTDTSLDDVDLIDYGKPYKPTSNLTLYAVYINDDYVCNSYPDMASETVMLDYPHVAYLDKAFVAPKLTTNSAGSLTYESSNPSVATVDTTTGAVTIKAAGTAVITVTQAASGKFGVGKASYTILVKE